jgi:long-chain-fatty-acid--[acyl-carrier-protein] ligase
VLGRNKEILTIFGQKYCANAVELVAENAGGDAIGRCAACTRNADGVPELWIVCERPREDASAEPAPAVAARIAEAVTRQFDLSPRVLFVKFGALPRTSSGKLRRDVELLDQAAVPAASLR